MRLKTYILTALLTTGFFFPSCEPESDCGSGKPTPHFFDIEGMNLRNYKAKYGDYDCCSGTTLESGANVTVDSFRLNIQFEVSYFGNKGARPSPFFLGLMNEALACSPLPPGYNGSQEQIESLTIITLNDLDSLHVAGDTINDLFYVYEFGKRKELSEFLANNISFIKEEAISLQLKSGSDMTSNFSARVNLTLKNGEAYSAESEPVSIR